MNAPHQRQARLRRVEAALRGNAILDKIAEQIETLKRVRVQAAQNNDNYAELVAEFRLFSLVDEYAGDDKLEPLCDDIADVLRTEYFYDIAQDVDLGPNGEPADYSEYGLSYRNGGRSMVAGAWS